MMVRELLPPAYRVHRLPTETPALTSPAFVSAIVRALPVNGVPLADLAIEAFGVLTFDGKRHVIAYHVVSVGTVDHTIVHPREIFRAAILELAASVILFHNHPSGDPAPSEADRRATANIVAAGLLLQIPVDDHLIIAPGDRYYSFLEGGLL